MQSKIVLFFSVLLVALAFFFGPALKNNQHIHEVEKTELASIGGFCSNIVYRHLWPPMPTPAFDIKKFQYCLEQFSSARLSQIVPDLDANSPEELLALLETFSDQKQSLNFSEVLDQLSPTDLENIKLDLNRFNGLKVISERDIHKLLVQIHRLIHPPKRLRDTLGDGSPILTNLNLISEDHLINSIDLDLATKNLLQVFSRFRVMKQPGALGRLRNFLAGRKNVLKGLMLAGTAVAYFKRGALPTYLPLFNTIDPQEISQQRWAAFRNGGDDKEIRDKLDIQLRVIFLTRVYNLGARIALIVYLTSEFAHSHQTQTQPKANTTQTLQELSIASQTLLAPIAQGDLLFDKYIESKRATSNGAAVDPNSVANLKIRDMFRQAALDTANRQNP